MDKVKYHYLNSFKQASDMGLDYLACSIIAAHDKLFPDEPFPEDIRKKAEDRCMLRKFDEGRKLKEIEP